MDKLAPFITRITEEQSKEISRALTEIIPDDKCQVCGHTEMAVGPGYVVLQLQPDLEGMIIGGGATIPVAAIVCEKCGNTRLHALGALGLLSEKAKVNEAVEGK